MTRLRACLAAAAALVAAAAMVPVREPAPIAPIAQAPPRVPAEAAPIGLEVAANETGRVRRLDIPGRGSLAVRVDVSDRDLDHEPFDEASSLPPADEAGARLEARLAEARVGDDPLTVETVLALWRAAADAEASEEATVELSALTFSVDPQVAHAAVRALDDLERLRADREATAAERVLGGPPLGPQGSLPLDDPLPDRNASARADMLAVAETDAARSLAVRIEQAFAAPSGEAREAVRELWRFAADHGVSDAALDALREIALLDPDLGVQQLAGRAYEDLVHLTGDSSRMDDRGRPLPMDSTDDPVARVARAGGRRAEQSLATLYEGAVDVDESVRYEAVLGLWRTGADRAEDRGDVLESLSRSLADVSPRVSELAAQAIEDLKRVDLDR